MAYITRKYQWELTFTVGDLFGKFSKWPIALFFKHTTQAYSYYSETY